MSLLCGVYVYGSPHKIDINGDKPDETSRNRMSISVPFPTTATSTASCRFSAGSAAACQPGFCWDSQNCSPQYHHDFLGSCRAHCGSHRFVCGFRCFRSQPNLTVSGSGSQIFGQQASSGRRGVQTLETPRRTVFMSNFGMRMESTTQQTKDGNAQKVRPSCMMTRDA